ncbi:MAG: hypothetical protein CTY29_06235 [Methylobacter sp.]|nr:MAG: hypothetical protein CTY29_06235 [Methylobacter sp.]PPD19698.1 MAG: hypothetical protein CTY24_10370 [Methylobacter sp.]PPD36707.1 MAG: hypothetical protein CTY18_02690 [Methylomonas sp.]
MLQIEQVIRPAEQGITTPFLCKAHDNNYYFIKGYRANIDGLIKEWLGAHLARAFGLEVPDFDVAYLDKQLVANYNGDAASELKAGIVFASKKVDAASELRFETITLVDKQTRLNLLVFDLWVENEDRTLSVNGGNPNLLWKTDKSKLYVFDHNLIFDPRFDKLKFWQTHVFSSVLCNKQADWLEKMEFERRMKNALDSWQSAWDSLPEEWRIKNEGHLYFNPERHQERLNNEANGDIWLKLNGKTSL